MPSRRPILFILLFALTACAQLEDAYQRHAGSPTDGQVDGDTMVLGLKQALEQGAARAVTALGRENGYYQQPAVRIPMPANLARVERRLRKFGQGKYADEFVLSLNRAAESAAPEAKAVFLRVIGDMTIQDAVGIVRGPDNAATAYFRRNSESELVQRFRPIVAQATDRVGVTRRYKTMIQPLGAAAFVMGDVDLDAYVTQKALDGLFLMIAQEEKHIREDPLARTTEILRRVFQ